MGGGGFRLITVAAVAALFALGETSCRFNSTEERDEYTKRWPGICPEAGKECSIKLYTDIPIHPPLVLDTNYELYEDRSPSIPSGGKLLFSCADKKFILDSKVSDIMTECKDGKLMYNQQEVQWKSLGCANEFAPKVFKTDLSHLKDIVLNCDNPYAFGYLVNRRNVPVGDFCFDAASRTTRWTTHEIQGSVPVNQWTPAANRPDWTADPALFPNLDMDRIYSVERQDYYFDELLRYDNYIVDAVNDVDDRFYNRGHLAPWGDFTSNARRRATMVYSNCLPQWIAFNGGNWESIEAAVKQLALNRGHDLRIYTGGMGVSEQYNSLAGVWVNLFLGNSIIPVIQYDTIPVPDKYWKVVYDPRTNEAVVFITTNDPNAEVAPIYGGNNPINSRCANLEWIPLAVRNQFILPNRNNPFGFTSCFTLREFMRIYPTLGIHWGAHDAEPALLATCPWNDNGHIDNFNCPP